MSGEETYASEKEPFPSVKSFSKDPFSLGRRTPGAKCTPPLGQPFPSGEGRSEDEPSSPATGIVRARTSAIRRRAERPRRGGG